MIAKEDQHQVVIAVGRHVRDEAAQRVFDGGSVVGLYSTGLSGQDRLRRIIRWGHAVEDGAVTDVVQLMSRGIGSQGAWLETRVISAMTGWRVRVACSVRSNLNSVYWSGMLAQLNRGPRYPMSWAS